jgi:hypothetical protein
MKSWEDLNILINDYELALTDQNTIFSKKILSFLNTGPKFLVQEFKNHPNAIFKAKNGDWMSLWAGGVKIDGEFYEHKTVINRIEELLPAK